MKIIELVPNFSEGTNEDIMLQIIEPFQKDKVFCCKLEMDKDYNRSVVTVIGEANVVIAAMVEATKIAAKLIDLTKHHGVHPRIGAVDVIPIIPVTNISVSECMSLAKKLANIIYLNTNIPIFFYAKSATNSSRIKLSDIRKGEFEGLFDKIKEDKWLPDYGLVIHPTAGASVVGVRGLLIAYNVDVNCHDITIVKKIAKTIRESSGGIKGIQALGVFIKSRNVFQVTINITDYTQISMYKAFLAVDSEARKYGFCASGSELIGLIPYQALIDSLIDANVCIYKSKLELIGAFKELLKLSSFGEDKIIETYLP